MIFRFSLLAAFAATACVLCPSVALADTANLGAFKDTTIFQNNVNNSGGGGPALFVGTNGTTSPRRSLIQFDIAGGIPTGASITSVTLSLTVGQLAGSGGGSGGSANTSNNTISLYDLSADWGEGTVGNTATTIGGSGQGGAAQMGDATWNARMYSGTLWATAGGDHASTSSASLFVATPTVNTTYTWSSSLMVADVQNWLNDPTSNHGWESINGNETLSTDFLAFYSKEGPGETGNSSTYVPQLSIVYNLSGPGSVPEPSSVFLATLALIAMVLAKPARRLWKLH